MNVTPLAVAAKSRIVDILVEAAHPTTIILFGSHARDESHIDSDVDQVVTTYPTVASLRERGLGLDRDLSYDDMKEIAHDDRLAARKDTEA